MELPGKFMVKVLYGWNDQRFEEEYLSYQKSSYKHGESSQKLQTTMSSAIKRGIEEIVKVTRAVGNKLAKIAKINLDPFTYTEAVSCPNKAQWRVACAEEIEQFVLFSTWFPSLKAAK